MDERRSPPTAAGDSHFQDCKTSTPPKGDVRHRRPPWRILPSRIRRIRRKYYIFLGAIVAILVIVALVASIVDWQKHRINPTALRDLQADVVIWFNNDLLGSSSAQPHGAILLNRTMSAVDASANCSALHERQLDVNHINTTALIFWLGYSSGSDSQLYWVAKRSEGVCNAMTSDAHILERDCLEMLPSLCTSYAPIADQFSQDASTKYQISVNSSGQVLRGYRDRRSFRFLGVRYAEQPLRFNHSVPWSGEGVFDATKPGAVCMQGLQGSEDCLFLNIWTPSLPQKGIASAQLRPVIVWIHGGAFQGDSGTNPTFDGGNWASRGDVVTVTINYRLGNLGFLVINDTSATGNYGFGDQVTALTWVQEHISDFGGDPSRITVAGQSAGAAAVRAMLGSPLTMAKFSAAIMQSNLGGYGFAQPYSSYMSLSDYQANFTTSILKQIGCNGRASLPCVQKTSAKTLSNVQQAAFLVQDGLYITSPEFSMNETSPIANVTVLMGQMQGDAVFFVAPEPETANLTDLIWDTPWNSSVLSNPSDFIPVTPNQTQITDVSSNLTDSDSVAAVYNISVEAGNDAMFRCVDQATAYAAADNSALGPVWYYEMQRSYIVYPSRPACNAPVEPAFPFGNPENQTYKCHTGDNLYTFGNVVFMKQPDRDGQDVLFAQLALDSWTAFARDHDPNPDMDYLRARGYWNTIGMIESAGHWPAVDSASPSKRLLSTASVDVGFTEGDQCNDLGLPLLMFD